jgi:hypothetical protein
MAQNYVSINLLQVSFLISCFLVANTKFVSNFNLKSPQAESLLDGSFSGVFTSTQKAMADNTAYTFFKTKTSFVNYYLDFALSRGGGGGGGDDDGIGDHFTLPIISGNYEVIKEINTI